MISSDILPRTKAIAHPPLAFEPVEIKTRLLNLEQPCYVVQHQGKIGITNEDWWDEAEYNKDTELLMAAPPLSCVGLGDRAFLDFHGVKYAYMTGAMAGGIASEELVIALGRQGVLASFGAGGLGQTRVEAAIKRIQQALPNATYAFNLLHSPNEPELERNSVELYLKYGVKTVEASAFLDLTPNIVYYRAAGLGLNTANQIEIKHKVIAKISRREVATKFLQPAPLKILEELVYLGKITQLQADLAQKVPMADDLTVEADSGGHTDNRPLVCLFPSIVELRDEIQNQYNYQNPVRIGVAGGISTPHAALAAYIMGAAYVVTGSVNQSCVEAGTSQHAKKLLAEAQMHDVMMAPAADMFEMGVKLQVLKRGTMFALRAQKLYELYKTYDSIADIPTQEQTKIEKQIFRMSLDEVWQRTVNYLSQRNPDKLAKANSKPKLKMALIFRWYLGLSSRWSNTGEAGREIDYQIWCGPAMGAFNNWVEGSYLEPVSSRHVYDVAYHILTGATYLYRIQNLKLQGLDLSDRYSQYQPTKITNH
ncbi:PfaD family polyunsaturated fatty acid/polyketide biosynthesis protein [Pleurocapsales cyanobacterium LEGE 10410]|nr:PfaD family polyunsaturated fatty acid/polyketide biosynthesis protein [Pleurocapsales cyanobacterium LEGE 10410]